MCLRTQLLIPTKGQKRAGYLYIGHQRGTLLHLKKEKETLRNMAMIFSIRFSRMGRWQKATHLMKSEKMHSWTSSRTWHLIRLHVAGLLCVQCVYTYMHVCVRLCVCTNMFIVQMCGFVFMIHCSQIICWFMDILPFLFFSQCLDDLRLENTYNHVQD